MIWSPAAERMPRTARETLQWERLRVTLAWATERVPFYAERLRGAVLRGLTDLAALPFTRKSDLREHYPFGSSPSRRGSSRGCTPRRARRASPPSWATRRATWTSGAR